MTLFEQTRPALVLLDVMMPGRDGWEVCRLMRQHPALGKRVRIIMVTALDEWDDKRQALQTGADDYVAKPFDLPKLAATVERNAAPCRRPVSGRRAPPTPERRGRGRHRVPPTRLRTAEAVRGARRCWRPRLRERLGVACRSRPARTDARAVVLTTDNPNALARRGRRRAQGRRGGGDRVRRRHGAAARRELKADDWYVLPGTADEVGRARAHRAHPRPPGGCRRGGGPHRARPSSSTCSTTRAPGCRRCRSPSSGRAP
jgi:CheY-like chemotaxis protein